MIKRFIIKDSREQKGFDFPEQDWCKGTKIEKLDVGDYSIEDVKNIFIDRKQSPAEIAHNFTEDRFVNLLEKIKDYKYKFILCEFSYEDVITYPFNTTVPRFLWKKVKLRGKALEYFISKLSIKYGISFLFAGNAKNAERLCYALLTSIYKQTIDV